MCINDCMARLWVNKIIEIKSIYTITIRGCEKVFIECFNHIMLLLLSYFSHSGAYGLIKLILSCRGFIHRNTLTWTCGLSLASVLPFDITGLGSPTSSSPAEIALRVLALTKRPHRKKVTIGRDAMSVMRHAPISKRLNRRIINYKCCCHLQKVNRIWWVAKSLFVNHERERKK